MGPLLNISFNSMKLWLSVCLAVLVARTVGTLRHEPVVFSGLAAQTSCFNGSFYSTVSLGCEKCSPGKYARLNNQTVCLDCPKGTFNNQTGASTCRACPRLFSTDNEGDRACSYCIAGKFYIPVNANQSVFNNSVYGTCDVCPKGSYSTVNSTDCTSCPLYTTTTIVLGETIDDCSSCVFGFYGNLSVSISNQSCSQCVLGSGISCPEGSILPLVSPGYFRSPKNVSFAYTCIPSSACLDSGKDLVTKCSSGYSGFNCGNCDDGFYRLDFFCMPCLNSALRGFLLSLLIFGCLLIVYRVVAHPDKLNIEVRIWMQSIQTLGLFSSISTKWPAALLVILQMASLSVSIFSIVFRFHIL